VPKQSLGTRERSPRSSRSVACAKMWRCGTCRACRSGAARGRPRKYGAGKISLATYRPAGGASRVVLVTEDHGYDAFFCTGAEAGVATILEAFAGRATIEQDFHGVKEV